MKKTVIGCISICLFLSGCGQHFSSLSNSPSSITITKYESSNNTNKATYKLTGKKMDALYQAIQKDAKHILPKNATIDCPTYMSGTVVWDYHIVIHYPNHSDLSFTQSTLGCTFVKDDQTGATSLGNLPGLSPFNAR